MEENKMKQFLNKYAIEIIVFALLFITPSVLQGNEYIVGGDDMKLYYIFPDLYLKNFAFNLVTDNTLAGAMTGYATVSYFAPFFFIIYLLKFIPLNTQAIMYGANFAFGFLFMYMLLKLFISDTKLKIERSTERAVLTISSLLYIFSPYLNETLYSHQMMHIFLVSVVPAVLYFFTKSIFSGNIRYALFSVLVFSIFSTTVNSLPYTAAFTIVSIPFLVYLGIRNIKRSVNYFLVSALVFFLLNFFWIFHLLYATFFNSGLISSTQVFSGETFTQENVRIASGVSTLYSPLNQVFYTMMQGAFTPSFIIIIGIFVLFYIITGLFLARSQNNEFKKIYYVSFASFLLAWYFFSPNLGTWGPTLFVYLTKNIPFFGMFRNMYDKFSLAFAFYYVLVFGLSFVLIVQHIKFRYLKILLFLIPILYLLLHIPRLLNPLIPDREGLSRITGVFNSDYQDLAIYMGNMKNTSRTMWLPLNVPTYSLIQDVNSNYYAGLSPMRELANRSDFTGRFSFLTQEDIFLGDKVFQLIREGRYDEVGLILQKLNVRYIIVDRQIVPNNLNEFFYGGKNVPVLAMQTEAFKKTIIGEKIRDFGTRYTLYEINKDYISNTLFLSDNSSVFSNNDKTLEYTKQKSYLYNIKISEISTDTNLIFLDPYYKDWRLYLVNGNKKKPYMKGLQTVYMDYANQWYISVSEMKSRYKDYVQIDDQGNISFAMELYFEPNRFNYYIYAVSIATLIGLIVYLIFPAFTYGKKRYITFL